MYCNGGFAGWHARDAERLQVISPLAFSNVAIAVFCHLRARPRMHAAALAACAAIALGPVAAWLAERAVALLALRLDKRGLPFLLADSAVHGVVAAAVWGAGVVWATSVASRAGATRRLLHGSLFRADLSCTSPASLAGAAWATYGWAAESTVACAILACLLDVDHFAAGWWHSGRPTLSAAMHLPTRPFGHAAAFVVSATLVTAALAPRSPAWLGVAVAWGTHLLRDALRRGLWLWPAPVSSPPLPELLYLALLGGGGAGTGAALVWLGSGAAARLATAAASDAGDVV